MPEIRRLTSQQPFMETENFDLPRLACNAAFELDNLLIGEYADLSEIKSLAKLLTQQNCQEEGSLLLDPTTVMVMSMAIDDAEPSLGLTSSIEVITETNKMGKALLQVASNNNVDPIEIQKLRNYCLALSERASGNEQTLGEWEPKHPWRR